MKKEKEKDRGDEAEANEEEDSRLTQTLSGDEDKKNVPAARVRRHYRENPRVDKKSRGGRRRGEGGRRRSSARTRKKANLYLYREREREKEEYMKTMKELHAKMALMSKAGKLHLSLAEEEARAHTRSRIEAKVYSEISQCR